MWNPPSSNDENILPSLCADVAATPSVTVMPTPVLENPEHQTKWYSRYFLGKFHRNYVGQDATDAKSIYALSGK